MLLAQRVNSEFQTVFWNIESVDEVTGDAFEKIITNLYNAIEGFSAEKTPHSNDNGADVVVKNSDKKTGFLIQCKHTENIQKKFWKTCDSRNFYGGGGL